MTDRRYAYQASEQAEAFKRSVKDYIDVAEAWRLSLDSARRIELDWWNWGKKILLSRGIDTSQLSESGLRKAIEDLLQPPQGASALRHLSVDLPPLRGAPRSELLELAEQRWNHRPKPFSISSTFDALSSKFTINIADMNRAIVASASGESQEEILDRLHQEVLRPPSKKAYSFTQAQVQRVVDDALRSSFPNDLAEKVERVAALVRAGNPAEALKFANDVFTKEDVETLKERASDVTSIFQTAMQGKGAAK